MYDPATGIIICVLINQLPAQAFQVSIQLLSTLINNPVGLTESAIPEKLMTVYPNPTNGLVQIKIPNQDIQIVKVYDIQGKLIKESTEKQFYLSDYPNGTYFIKVQTKQGFNNFKLIKR
jgi:hypothetical protein